MRTFLIGLFGLVAGFFGTAIAFDKILRAMGVLPSSCNITLFTLTPLVGLGGAVVAAVVAAFVTHRRCAARKASVDLRERSHRDGAPPSPARRDS